MWENIVTNSTPKKGLRKKYEAFFAPSGRLLANTRITPNMISLLSVGASLCSCLAYASGPEIGASLGLLLGTLLLGVSSLLDMMDGSLARARGTAGHFGALLDRTLDRLSEFFFLLGIMIGRYVIPELVFFCFEGMILASYVRSTAELRGGLNMDSTQGIFERKEKLTLLSIGCLLSVLLEFVIFPQNETKSYTTSPQFNHGKNEQNWYLSKMRRKSNCRTSQSSC